jgi:hypothetical protein
MRSMRVFLQRGIKASMVKPVAAGLLRQAD